ncbi:disease resistance protein RPM1-like [Pyrus ussuriensis x Pyrus communis]|uniref:Disease resistance protein RPM1-like n=1 Tax=Pyrus ussuriensis x Pyrus communis TaxID=2448454 RepID=A0A5N5I5P3_9ROSA|nr:disease resistance protein RPM1-like [Pyrus ussuriensis x Pyrus communis]
MASAAIDLLIGKTVGILESEASCIVGVRNQVDEIKQELISMKSFLRDADGKKAHTEGEEAWVASVRDLAYDVEDMIDEFMGRFARWLSKTLHISKYHWYRSRYANRLHKTILLAKKQITKTIKDIPERNQRYGIDRIEGASSDEIQRWVKNQAESSLFIMDDELVGIEGKKQLLIEWLMNGEQQQTVVSVAGMGGSGKTTLVVKIFSSESVKRNFSCHAWVPTDLYSMSYRELLQIIVTYLESRRYLVVLDDVWDVKILKEIRIALPNRQLGSRIMLTARKEDIACYSFGLETHVHRIQPLESNEAWELFNKKAFSTYSNNCCPPELELSTWELLGKCKGLPLAIVALGGLMSSKESAAEWNKVRNSLNWHLIDDHFLEPVKTILLLSFNDLPYRLKHYFLYCSIFPEDYLIRTERITERITRLWIAEGFVEHVKGVMPEEVAESYLMELNFPCKMHDLMRELVLSISEKEKFCVVYDGREVVEEEIGARRLSIQIIRQEINSCKGMSQLCSFHVFAPDIFSQSISNTFLSQFKLLRILDLEDVQIEELPNYLMYVFNLRYLNLSRTPIKKLHESIGQLFNLQTLDIMSWEFTYAKGIRAPSTIYMLRKLQVLSFIESNGDIIQLVENMTQLTRLGITNIKGSDEIDLCASIQKMKLLYYLYLLVNNDQEFLRIKALASPPGPPTHLQGLLLSGKLAAVPSWFGSLKNLTDISLRWSRLEEDVLPHMEALPCLRRLILVNAYLGNELFEKYNNSRCDAFLVLHNCMELETLPNGLQYLTNLETLRLVSVPLVNCQIPTVPTKLMESLHKRAVDHPKVQHIHKTNHIWNASSRSSSESLP